MIAPCSCKHEAQDVLHGPGMRAFNARAKGNYKCTVCGALRGEEKKEKK